MCRWFFVPPRGVRPAVRTPPPPSSSNINNTNQLLLWQVALVVPCAEVQLWQRLMQMGVQYDAAAAAGSMGAARTNATRLALHLLLMASQSALAEASSDGRRLVFRRLTHWGWTGEWVTLSCAAPRLPGGAAVTDLSARLEAPLQYGELLHAAVTVKEMLRPHAFPS